MDICSGCQFKHTRRFSLRSLSARLQSPFKLAPQPFILFFKQGKVGLYFLLIKFSGLYVVYVFQKDVFHLGYLLERVSMKGAELRWTFQRVRPVS